MGSRVIGLDVGTHAVRAAELELRRNGTPALTRFGQVALPLGAMRDGEVVDVHAVSAALRRLWAEAGFKSNRVIAGVGNLRVIVRQAEVPAMSEADLRSAIRFEAQDLIPIPIDEAILDFQVLEHVHGAEQPMMRILLVAAHRDTVASLVAALDGADLTPSLIDIVPFALIRALGSTTDGLDPDRATAEAIVGIGAGVTNVVVHEDGVPRFVRMLVVGGNDVSESIAADLGVDADTAEHLKRHADGNSSDQLAARAGTIVLDRMSSLVEEVQGSLDYYLAQPDAPAIGRVVVTGGGGHLPGLTDQLARALGIEVRAGHVLENVRIGRTGISEDRLVAAESVLTVPIGLALAGRPPENGKRRLDLMPVEVSAGQQRRRQAVAVGACVGASALLLGGLWVSRAGAVDAQRQRAEEAEAAVVRIQSQVGSLQGANQLETQLAQRRQLVTSALSDDLSWVRLFNEIATVIPNDVWLTSFSGASATEGSNSGSSSAGTINVAAKGFDHTSAARWLLRLSQLESLSDVWLPSSTKQKGTSAGEHDMVTFSSTANLTPSAQSDRAEQFVEGEE
jgi:type IV pilus assembly protein PilM